MKVLVLFGLGILSAGLLAACQAAPVASVTPSSTVMPSATPAPTQTPLPPQTATPENTATMQATATPTPTKTPASKEVVWARGINPIMVLDDYDVPHFGYIGVPFRPWSPTANELIFPTCNSETRTWAFQRVLPPDFSPQPIGPTDLACGYAVDSITWTPDGQSLYFTGPLPDGHELHDDLEYSDLWMMTHDGRAPQRLVPVGFPGHWWDFAGWMNDQVVVTTQYFGGGTIFAATVGTVGDATPAASIFSGKTDRPNETYIPAMSGEVDVGLSVKLFVLSTSPQIHTDELKGIASGENLRLFPYYRGYHDEESDPLFSISTFFEDWKPGTNQMLVGFTDMTDMKQSIHSLWLWDLDTDQADVLVPHGLSGRFSPDGRLLAYITYAPAQVNAQGCLAPSGTATETDVRTFQLLDLTTGCVVLTLPIAELDDSSSFSFSPDGRYLAVGATGMPPDDFDWPAAWEADPQPSPVFVLIDLQAKQIVFREGNPQTLPLWAPSGNRAVYRQSDGNLALWDAEKGTLALTENPGPWPLETNWSFDGTYLSIVIKSETHPQFLVLPLP